VIWEKTGRPVSHLIVEVIGHPAEARTDSSGEFLFVGLPAGEITLVVYGEGIKRRVYRGVDITPNFTPHYSTSNHCDVCSDGIEICEM